MSAGDGPKFLGAPPAAPPPPPAPPGARPPPPGPPPPPRDPAADDVMSAYLAATASRVADARRWWASARWHARGGWRGAWVEQRVGGLAMRVPGSWRHAPDPRGVLWDLPGGGFATLAMIGFEKRAPSIAEWLAQLGGDDETGLTRIESARVIDHPHRDAPRGAAMEIAAHSFTGEEWPVRWSCHALWSGTALLSFAMVTDGPPSADLAADFVAVWRGLR
jgi:hypothetical protein